MAAALCARAGVDARAARGSARRQGERGLAFGSWGGRTRVGDTEIEFPRRTLNIAEGDRSSFLPGGI